MTPADLFHRAGVALFGEQYVAPMAVLLDVDKNTVGKWRDGKSRIPPGVWSRVGFDLNQRAEQASAVATEIAASGFASLPEIRRQGR